MLKILPFILTLALHADDIPSKLHGTWEVDAEATKAYLFEHAKLNNYQKKVLPEICANTTISYNPDGSGTVKMDARNLTKIDGTKMEIPETVYSFKFEVIGESENQVVIKTATVDVDILEGLLEEYKYSLIKFHNKDSYSVSLSDGPTNINGREFFKRVAQPK